LTNIFSAVIIVYATLLSVHAQDKVADKAHAAQLKLVNVEMANRTATLMSDDPESKVAEPSLSEQLYQMVFKRNAKKEKEEKKEDTKEEGKYFWKGHKLACKLLK
jgi:hypothetical protein